MALGFLGETDDLGVAAALEIEDSVVTPAVLVVAYQRSVRVGRETGLARPGKPEEQGHIALVPHVCRTVHGEHFVKREQIVEDGEYGFLDLPTVARAADEDRLFAEVNDDEGLRVRAEGLGAVCRPGERSHESEYAR